MLGAVVGDIVGSRFEFDNIKTKRFDLFNKEESEFTDDSVMTVAVADICNSKDFSKENIINTIKKWGRKYPDAGYGSRFYYWVLGNDNEPYYSCGNGSAMRVSPIGWYAKTKEEVIEYATKVTEVTHNHPEGIKGAVVTAMMIFMARNGASRKELEAYATLNYPEIVNLDYDYLVETYSHDKETCQASMPQALYCFLISKDFEDCLRTTISIGGDCDTTSAISCAIAEAFYKGVPDKIATEAMDYLPLDMLETIVKFDGNYKKEYAKFGSLEFKEDYEKKIAVFDNYRELNAYVMNNTYEMCKSDKDLIDSINHSVMNQKMYHGIIDRGTYHPDRRETKYIVSGERTLEAAKKYKGKRVMVLNFANNHSIGGAPWSAGAQEESMCRISTLYQCLLKEKEEFYDYHRNLYDKGIINDYGNHDLIITPDVSVFKTDESRPKMLDKKDWYNVDVLTCAAPENRHKKLDPNQLDIEISIRIETFLMTISNNKPDVLILGAWGCGAFGNDPKLVAKYFHEYTKIVGFDTVELAMGSTESDNYNVFYNEFKNEIENN